MEDTSYLELKAITDQYYTDWKMPPIKVFSDLLKKHGIGLRNKDGELLHITFSIPTSLKDAIVLGVRYEKKDGSFSEDLFLFREKKPIEKGYKGRLEKTLPEYKGMHKRVPDTL